MTTQDFISKAKKVHGDKYDYSQVNYVKCTIPVTIICPIHGPFEQTPKCHLGGCGCKKCASNAKYTTETFIEAARKVHGDKYDYSKVDYIDRTTEIIIICPIHGEFKQRPDAHLRGSGCQKCAGNARYTTETFIEAARKIHGDKYDYSKVEYKKSSIPIKIICPIHGEFEQTPACHLQGEGCKYCAGNVKYTTETFIEAARKVHGDKYDYSKVEYVKSSIEVTIICPIHGEFKQTPNSHLQGKGCKYCSGKVKHTTEEFIELARKIHGNKYDYSKVDYIDYTTDVIIICPIHGEFKQTPSVHLRGCGCQKCGGRIKYTTETFIEAARKVHGDKYDYSKVNYIDSTTDVTIICPIHGEFKQKPANHLQGFGCQKCGGTAKYTQETFIEAARKIHGDKYDYSKVNYVDYNKRIIIICPKHGPFEQTPAKHLAGHGCIYCSGCKYTTEDFIKIARKVHGDKYDYSKVNYINSTTDVTIICPIHGEFKQKPVIHLQGHGCRKCASVKYTTETFIETARKVHGDKYDYSKVNYVDCFTEVIIICPLHGEFKQKPAIHLQGYGCKECSGHKRYSTETFIDVARKIHGDKYDYSKVNYINSTTEVTIICPIHGEFKQLPHSHLKGYGCSKCKKSKLVLFVIKKLEQENIQYEIEQDFDWLIYKKKMHLDIYLPEYNTAIECHGLQHFKPIDYFGGQKCFETIYDRDRVKHDLCESNGVKLFYFAKEKIDQYEFGQVYNDLDELLNIITN